MKDIKFEIDPTLVVQSSHVFLDGNSWAKHYSYVYDPITPPTPYDPQDVALVWIEPLKS